MIDKITIDIDETLTEAIRQQVIEQIAREVAWKVKDQLIQKVERSLKALDQATINRTVTECLVAEHLGRLKVIEKGKE